MPGSVRARFAAQLEQDPENANAKRMLENFDRALSHPDEADLAAAAFFSNGKLGTPLLGTPCGAFNNGKLGGESL